MPALVRLFSEHHPSVSVVICSSFWWRFGREDTPFLRLRRSREIGRRSGEIGADLDREDANPADPGRRASDLDREDADPADLALEDAYLER